MVLILTSTFNKLKKTQNFWYYNEYFIIDSLEAGCVQISPKIKQQVYDYFIVTIGNMGDCKEMNAAFSGMSHAPLLKKNVTYYECVFYVCNKKFMLYNASVCVRFVLQTPNYVVIYLRVDFVRD
jgi:hypothetical protein